MSRNDMKSVSGGDGMPVLNLPPNTVKLIDISGGQSWILLYNTQTNVYSNLLGNPMTCDPNGNWSCKSCL